MNMDSRFVIIYSELPTKYPREEIFDPPTKYSRENFEPTKYPRDKILDPRNNHEIKFWTHEILMIKNFGPTRYPPENILDPRNTHEKKFRTYEGTMVRLHKTNGIYHTLYGKPIWKKI